MPRRRGLISLNPVQEATAAANDNDKAKRKTAKKKLYMLPAQPKKKPPPRKTQSISRGIGMVLDDMKEHCTREMKTYQFFEPSRKEREPFLGSLVALSTDSMLVALSERRNNSCLAVGTLRQIGRGRHRYADSLDPVLDSTKKLFKLGESAAPVLSEAASEEEAKVVQEEAEQEALRPLDYKLRSLMPARSATGSPESSSPREDEGSISADSLSGPETKLGRRREYFFDFFSKVETFNLDLELRQEGHPQGDVDIERGTFIVRNDKRRESLVAEGMESLRLSSPPPLQRIASPIVPTTVGKPRHVIQEEATATMREQASARSSASASGNLADSFDSFSSVALMEMFGSIAADVRDSSKRDGAPPGDAMEETVERDGSVTQILKIADMTSAKGERGLSQDPTESISPLDPTQSLRQPEGDSATIRADMDASPGPLGQTADQSLDVVQTLLAQGENKALREERGESKGGSSNSPSDSEEERRTHTGLDVRKARRSLVQSHLANDMKQMRGMLAETDDGVDARPSHKVQFEGAVTSKHATEAEAAPKPDMEAGATDPDPSLSGSMPPVGKRFSLQQPPTPKGSDAEGGARRRGRGWMTKFDRLKRDASWKDDPENTESLLSGPDPTSGSPRDAPPVIPKLNLSLSLEGLKVKSARDDAPSGPDRATNRSGAATERLERYGNGWEGGTQFLKAITDRMDARRTSLLRRVGDLGDKWSARAQTALGEAPPGSSTGREQRDTLTPASRGGAFPKFKSVMRGLDDKPVSWSIANHAQPPYAGNKEHSAADRIRAHLHPMPTPLNASNPSRRRRRRQSTLNPWETDHHVLKAADHLELKLSHAAKQLENHVHHERQRRIELRASHKPASP